MLVFTVVFGKLARIGSDGAPTPYSTSSPWSLDLFLERRRGGDFSLVTNAGMISKVYFPRLILPLAAVAAKLVDFVIAACPPRRPPGGLPHRPDLGRSDASFPDRPDGAGRLGDGDLDDRPRGPVSRCPARHDLCVATADVRRAGGLSGEPHPEPL